LNDESATNELLQALDIQPDLGGEEISKLAVAVARILLRDVAASLPQWSTMRDEVLIVARDNAWVQDVLRPLGIIPAELFEINWAGSGPGFSWPECTMPVPCRAWISSSSPPLWIRPTCTVLLSGRWVGFIAVKTPLRHPAISSVPGGSIRSIPGISNRGATCLVQGWYQQMWLKTGEVGFGRKTLTRMIR